MIVHENVRIPINISLKCIDIDFVRIADISEPKFLALVFCSYCAVLNMWRDIWNFFYVILYQLSGTYSPPGHCFFYSLTFLVIGFNDIYTFINYKQYYNLWHCAENLQVVMKYKAENYFSGILWLSIPWNLNPLWHPIESESPSSLVGFSAFYWPFLKWYYIRYLFALRIAGIYHALTLFFTSPQY